MGNSERQGGVNEGRERRKEGRREGEMERRRDEEMEGQRVKETKGRLAYHYLLKTLSVMVFTNFSIIFAEPCTSLFTDFGRFAISVSTAARESISDFVL